MTLIPMPNDEDMATPFVAVVLTPMPEDAPEWARILQDNMVMLASGVNQTNSAIGSILEIVDSIKDQVGPLVDSLSNSPMVRMLTGGKK